jgi:hypothetical protein
MVTEHAPSNDHGEHAARSPSFGLPMLMTQRDLTALLTAFVPAFLAACGGDVVPSDAAPDLDAQDEPVLDAAAAEDAGPSVDATLPDDVPRQPIGAGARYCELLLAFAGGAAVRVEVWGTQTLNDCPMSDWDAIDTDAVRASSGATVVLRNGPRYWLPDRTSGEIPDRDPIYFGTLLMQQLASIELPAGGVSSMPYTERTILRDTRFEIDAGREVYELLAPDGSIYVMQSYAQIVDPTLDTDDLSGLAARLTLPMGWSYRARMLETPLVVDTPGMATVLQDDLQNSYSRYVDGSP